MQVNHTKNQLEKISIVTICYNIESSIVPTCESVIAQTYPNFEWIVVDGGSTDGTLDVLKSYEGRMTRLISEKDNGIYDALNKGIREASGTWIVFLNGGDSFASHSVLEEIFNKTRDDADIIYGNTLLSKEGKVFDHVHADDVNEAGRIFFFGNCINHQSAFIRRELFERYGLYDETYKICADHEKWVVFATNNCRFKWEDIFVAIYDVKGVSGVKTSRKQVGKERKMIQQTYFSRKEHRRAKRLQRQHKYQTVSYRGRLPGKISLVSIQESRNRRKRRYCFLFLPLLKLRYTDDARLSSKAYLFNCIPLPKALLGVFPASSPQ